MLPAYCAMMLITANIVPHLGDGPLWPQKAWSEAETCKKNWWTNLLFISNFIDAKYEVRLRRYDYIHLCIFLCILKQEVYTLVKKNNNVIQKLHVSLPT